MDRELQRAVQDRLHGAGLDEAQTAMVVAACTGTPLEQAADGVWPDALDDDTATATAASTGVFLGGIAVEGFRGVGERRHLDLTPGPGLTVVVGRNGSGKSSFAEGLEMALTGESNRWADKPVV